MYFGGVFFLQTALSCLTGSDLRAGSTGSNQIQLSSLFLCTATWKMEEAGPWYRNVATVKWISIGRL